MLDPYAVLALLGFLVFMFYIIYNFINNTGNGRAFSDSLSDDLSDGLIHLLHWTETNRPWKVFMRFLSIFYTFVEKYSKLRLSDWCYVTHHPNYRAKITVTDLKLIFLASLQNLLMSNIISLWFIEFYLVIKHENVTNCISFHVKINHILILLIYKE